MNTTLACLANELNNRAVYGAVKPVATEEPGQSDFKDLSPWSCYTNYIDIIHRYFVTLYIDNYYTNQSYLIDLLNRQIGK